MSKMIKAKCPGCRVILDVTNVNNEPQRQIQCPNCGKNLLVPFYMVKKEPEAATQLGTKPQEYHTQLGGAQNTASSCALECNGMRYRLDVGTYRVGRKAVTSSADVQININDLYMSREHIIINVRRLSDGSLKADVSNHKNKNATFVNGVQLMPGDAVVLHNGDRIKMGETTVIFVANA